MKLIWIRWAGGIHTRDDGWKIYGDPRWAILHSPSGDRTKFRTVEDAKRYVETAP